MYRSPARVLDEVSLIRRLDCEDVDERITPRRIPSALANGEPDCANTRLARPML
jgi:hypothetical protein